MTKIMIIILFCIVILTGAIFMKTNSNPSPQYSDRYTFGNFTIISLYDGFLNLPLANIIKDDTNFDHPLFHAKPDATQKTAINVFLIDTGTQIILVDTGLAKKYGTQTGLLIDSLKTAGYKPEEISAIFITHLHSDHISGLLTCDGKKAFINAQLFINKAQM